MDQIWYVLMKSIFTHTVVAIVSCTCCFFLFSYFFPPQMVVINDHRTARVMNVAVDDESPLINQSPSEIVNTAYDQDFKSVSRKVTPAVVNIVSRGATGYRLAGGSGVIISSGGYIITNNHVIEDASTIDVTLNNRRTFSAEVVGTDRQTDLALIKIEATDLQPLSYGNSDWIEVGEWVLAVGNPFNLASTVTAGIVSAKARNINILSGSYAVESFIQTDATVNPGNSGGALVNTKGELVGINTAIITKSGLSEGYSFAIPSNLVKKIVTDLMRFGVVQRAILGVQIDEVTDEIAADKNLPFVAGVLIRNVTEGGGASESDLRAGDIIISINGIPTPSVPELQEQIARYNPGDRISLEFFRSGKQFRKDGVQLKKLDPEGDDGQ
jgi:S1-C subfamily serine protease